MSPVQFYKCLADQTRLSCLLLIAEQGELCVCELMHALVLSQPKISRHLAQLRTCGLLTDRRQGKWVFYRLDPTLAKWAHEVLTLTLKNNSSVITDELQRLSDMQNRPDKNQLCC